MENEDFNNIAYMSIKEIHMNKILNKTKTYEFRNYIPKNMINKIYVYVPTPVKQLKYILEVNSPVKYPIKINECGIGNKEFNLGNKSKYAYPIKHVHELQEPITLKELKDKFGFTAPQAFTYGSKHIDLINKVNSTDIKQLY